VHPFSTDHSAVLHRLVGRSLGIALAALAVTAVAGPPQSARTATHAGAQARTVTAAASANEIDWP
jgi:hypothetical protein